MNSIEGQLEESPTKLAFLSPGLPPANGGVSQYTAVVASMLQKEFPCEVLCFVPDTYEEPAGGEFSSIQIPASGRGFHAAVEKHLGSKDLLVIEFSGYGFHRWGAPYWIFDGLNRWKESSRARIVVNFHELCIDPQIVQPRTLLYYVLQKRAIKALCTVTDYAICSTQSQKHFLRAYMSNERIRVLPVCSSVGEVDSKELLAERDQVLFLFGLRYQKEQILIKEEAQVDQFCRINGIKRIIEAGQELSSPVRCTVEREILGFIDDEALSSQLRRAQFGAFYHKPDRLNVSGVLAAYMAHGVTPVNFNPLMKEASTENPYALCAQQETQQKPFEPHELWDDYNKKRSLQKHAEVLWSYAQGSG